MKLMQINRCKQMDKEMFVLLVEKIETDFIKLHNPSKMFDTFANIQNENKVFTESNFINLCIEYRLFTEAKLSNYVAKCYDYITVCKELQKNIDHIETIWKRRENTTLIDNIALHLRWRLEPKDMVQSKMT